jgi:hypothetical protein
MKDWIYLRIDKQPDSTKLRVDPNFSPVVAGSVG